jgi:hypothetical protein
VLVYGLEAAQVLTPNSQFQRAAEVNTPTWLVRGEQRRAERTVPKHTHRLGTHNLVQSLSTTNQPQPVKVAIAPTTIKFNKPVPAKVPTCTYPSWWQQWGRTTTGRQTKGLMAGEVVKVAQGLAQDLHGEVVKVAQGLAQDLHAS